MQNEMILFRQKMRGGGSKMANYYTPFSLRVSETLLEKVKLIAAQNKRSANKEIEFVLEQYVRDYEAQHGVVETDLESSY